MLSRSRYRYLAVGLVAGAAALFGTTLIPAIDREMGPARVTITSSFGSGRTVVGMAPLGTVAATTHQPPLDFEISIAELDLQNLSTTLSEDSQEELISEIEDSLRAAAIQLGIIQIIGAAIIGLIVAALVAGRRPGYMAGGAASAALVVGAGLLVAAWSFDLDEFEEARYTGALQYAPQVMDAVNRAPDAFEDLDSRFATAANRLKDLMALVAQPLPDPHEGTTAILHVSDIHSNPLGVQIARRLASSFAVDAVVDTGDITSFGHPIESRVGRLLARFPVPYLLVPGNHDSESNRRELADAEGVVLLDESTYSVGSVEVLGWPDPTFTATNETSTDEGNERREEEAPEVAAAVERLDPDVLAVHDERLASESFGLVPLVLAGHTHERSQEQVDDTILLTVGSTGATGVGSFIVEADRPYEAEIIYFRADEPVAVDYLSLNGLDGDFEVDRQTLEYEDEG